MTTNTQINIKKYRDDMDRIIRMEIAEADGQDDIQKALALRCELREFHFELDRAEAK